MNNFKEENYIILTERKVFIYLKIKLYIMISGLKQFRARFAFDCLYKALMVNGYKPLTILTNCQNPFLIVLCIVFSFVVLLFSFSLSLTFLSICFACNYQNNFKVFILLLWAGFSMLLIAFAIDICDMLVQGLMEV